MQYDAILHFYFDTCVCVCERGIKDERAECFDY